MVDHLVNIYKTGMGFGGNRALVLSNKRDWKETIAHLFIQASQIPLPSVVKVLDTEIICILITLGMLHKMIEIIESRTNY